MNDKREPITQQEMDALMDKAAVRTAADLEQKYNIGKSFAEVTGIAVDARETAENAQESAENVYTDFDQDEIYKRLTKGKTTGLAKVGDDLYFHGGYIDELPNLYRKRVPVQECDVNVYPGQEEYNALFSHLAGVKQIPEEYLPNYDFSSDGEVDDYDLTVLEQIITGQYDQEYSPPVSDKISVVLNFGDVTKFILVTGLNAWGNTFERYIGVNGTDIPNLKTEQRLAELEQRIADLENR